MSQSFSRRTFLKYSAAAAVAVAGTSLLGGCSSGEDHTQTGTNTSNSVLKIKSTLKSAAYDAEKKTLTFEFEVNNGRISSVLVNRNSFYVEATNNYQALADSKISVRSTAEKIPDGVVAHGKTGTFMIIASGVRYRRLDVPGAYWNAIRPCSSAWTVLFLCGPLPGS